MNGNPLYAGLFGDPGSAALFEAPAELAAMIRVEAALALAQADLGVIPSDAAVAIAAACADLRIEPQSLAQATARNGVPVPALVAAMRGHCGDHGSWLHWGATSQDIMDSALALRLRDLLDLWEGRLRDMLDLLAGLAQDHADLPMAARTYGQVATPTSFGAVVAGWGWPLLTLAQDLPDLRARALRVSLSGAAGTLSAMGPQGPQVRAALARRLDLVDPGHGWHSDRSGPAHLADWAARLAIACGKMAEDLLLMTQSGLSLVRIEGGGASSTMPQKQNPVTPSAVAALGRQVTGLAATFRQAGVHCQQRDGAAWFTEWLTLPPLAVGTGAMLCQSQDCLSRLSPDAAAMARDLDAGQGAIHAEALTFALIEHAGLDRTTAAARVGRLCAGLRSGGPDLRDLATQEWSGHDWAALIAIRNLGQAPAEAGEFHARMLNLPPRPNKKIPPAC